MSVNCELVIRNTEFVQLE